MILNFLGKDIRLSWRLTHPGEWLMDLVREIKAFIQRGCHGYAESDVWDLDGYLCDWLPKALRQLADEVHGCPQEFYDETKKDDECWRWREALITMAEAFESKKIMEEDMKYDDPELNEKWQKGTKLLFDFFGNLWD